jgi:putative endonuclease
MLLVYILKCSDGTYYTGCANNIEDRLERHRNGEVYYAKGRLPLGPITYIAFSNRCKVFNFEKYLMTGSGLVFGNKRLI